jgi:hypothetical protein
VENASQYLLFFYLTPSSRKRSGLRAVVVKSRCGVVILELRAELLGWVRAKFLDGKLIIWAILLKRTAKSHYGGGGRGRRRRWNVWWLMITSMALVRTAGLTPSLTSLTFVMYFVVPQSIRWLTLCLVLVEPGAVSRRKHGLTLHFFLRHSSHFSHTRLRRPCGVI